MKGDDMEWRLQKLRGDKGVTQAMVADYLHCRQQTYSRYENGKAQPSLDVLRQLAIYFETSTDYLLGLTDDPEPYRQLKNKAKEQ